MSIPAPFEGALTEENPRLVLLREFLQKHYRMAPDEKMDGVSMSRAWTAWSQPRGLTPRPVTRFYSDLRYFGFTMKKGASNKMQVLGVAPQLHLEADLEGLEEAWADLPTKGEQELPHSVVSLAGKAIRDAIEIKREVVEAILADVMRIARDSMDDRVKLQAYEMLLSRSFPKVMPRTVAAEEEVIEVAEPIDHETLAEVEAVLAKRLAGGRALEEPRAS